MECFAREVRPAVPDAQLWMVCEDAPAAPGVTVLGRLSDEELIDRYQRAWVFCLPSSYEGLGIPYVEALASGTPVVATRNPGSTFVLDHGVFGVIAPVDELGAALTRFLRDDDWRREWSERALARREAFGLAAVAAEYERVYTRLMAGDAK
jgi:glycosyltransferase involved in cell wall biosynthesis